MDQGGRMNYLVNSKFNKLLFCTFIFIIVFFFSSLGQKLEAEALKKIKIRSDIQIHKISIKNTGEKPDKSHNVKISVTIKNNIMPDGSFYPIQDQMEVSLQMSFRNRPFRVWFFNVQRLGLGYQFSSSGEFTAITFSMRSWFTE